MPRKKTSKMTKAAGTAKRLSPEERSAIAAEPRDISLSKLAEKYGTTINTIGRYRKSAKAAKSETRPTVVSKVGKPAGKPGRPVKIQGGIPDGAIYSVEGDFIIIKIPRKHVLKHLMTDIIG